MLYHLCQGIILCTIYPYLRKILGKITHFQMQGDRKKSIIFYKSSAKELIEQDSVKNINIITLSSSAAQSLYQILRQIYSPLLSMVIYFILSILNLLYEQIKSTLGALLGLNTPKTTYLICFK